jgi:hypothetical protein
VGRAGGRHKSVIAVGSNLAAAFRHLRLPNRPRRLWVDRICIDQANDVEKAGQVRHVCYFRSASQVICWLGEEDEDTPAMLKLLSQIDGACTHFHERSSSTLVRDNPSREELLLLLGLTSDFDAWSALRKFLQRPWFYRVWTLQEPLVARQLSFVLGPHNIGPKLLRSLVELEMVLEHHSIGCLTDRAVTLRQHVTTGWNNIKSYMGPFAGWWETGDIAMPLNLLQTIQKLENDGLVFSRPLLTLLEESRQRHSSDPRDKIFALLCLASDKESYIGTVDYSIAIEDLYTSLTFMIIQCTGSLGILNDVEHPRHFLSASRRLDLHLPSWVPDWTQQWTNSIDWLIKNNGYFATGSLRARPGRTRIVGQSENYGIQLEGLFQGRVTDIVLMLPLWDDRMFIHFHRLPGLSDLNVGRDPKSNNLKCIRQHQDLQKIMNDDQVRIASHRAQRDRTQGKCTCYYSYHPTEYCFFKTEN